MSFFNGAEPVIEHEIDSDDSHYVNISFMDKIMSRPLTYYIVISLDNPVYNFWCGVEIISCLLSSYMYAYCSVFKNDIAHEAPGETWLGDMVYIFESIFMLSIIFKFFLEYQNEDEPLPVRNMKRIAMNYIQSEDFISDIIPTIPVPHLV